MTKRAVLLALGVMTIAGDLAAQVEAPAETSTVCWRARPKGTCKSWLVTEGIFEAPVTASSAFRRYDAGGAAFKYDDFEWRASATGGLMINTSANRAIGLTVSAPAEGGLSRAEFRYRAFLGQKNGLDFSGGFAQSTVRGLYADDETVARGVTASAGITNTYFGVDARVDLMRAGQRTVHGVFLTVRSGSRVGPLAAFLLGIARCGPSCNAQT